MPFITVTATAGFTPEQKKNLMQRTSDTVVETLNSPLKSVRVMLHELPQGNYLSAGQFDVPGVLFEVDLIAGRTEEAKAALISKLGKAAHETTGVPENDVRVRIKDFPNTDMGMEGGITAKAAGR